MSHTTVCPFQTWRDILVFYTAYITLISGWLNRNVHYSLIHLTFLYCSYILSDSGSFASGITGWNKDKIITVKKKTKLLNTLLKQGACYIVRNYCIISLNSTCNYHGYEARGYYLRVDTTILTQHMLLPGRYTFS